MCIWLIQNIQIVKSIMFYLIYFFFCIQNTLDEAFKLPPSAPSVVVSFLFNCSCFRVYRQLLLVYT